MKVVKSGGDEQPFDETKLKQSLLRSGASIFLANEIVEKVETHINDGASTDHIYKIAYKELQKESKISAVRYSLKRSLLTLGPSGFPFEQFFAKVLESKGYIVKTNQIVKGHCVDHEVDVMAIGKKERIVVEVKFHNKLSIKSDTKTALYVKARIDDLKGVRIKDALSPQHVTKGILVTNTKFTDNATKYAKCAGIELISWEYPRKGNLYDLVYETGHHPITCLTTLSKDNKRDLLTRGIVHCKSIMEDKELLSSINISEQKKGKVLDEVRRVCYYD